MINIFGGIVKCDQIAQGIIQAATEVGLTLPLVCRLTGTNADKANQMLKEFSQNNKSLKIQTA